MSEKAREVTLRRAAARQGLRLIKSRRRDARALDYGLYWLVPLQGNQSDPLTVENGMTLDQAERRLRGA